MLSLDRVAIVSGRGKLVGPDSNHRFSSGFNTDLRRGTVTGVLIAAAIPTALAGTIQNYAGLMLIRFFVGIAGASFVPTLNWCTMFYDKNVVGTGESTVRDV